LQKPGKELMENLSNLVRDAIKKYFEYNKFAPECIIFFRDGVGEG